jgi:AcrR family transcriptional regulator
VSAAQNTGREAASEPTGTKARLVQAAIATLQTKGFAGTSAREIAATGDLNQALVFYHYGSVQNLLLAALDVVSARRLTSYGPRFERASTVGELAILAKEIYQEDLENGYVTVLAEMVAGGVSDRDLGLAVVERIEPWIEMVAMKLSQLTAGTVLSALVPARETAFAIVALYLGMDLLSQLDGGHGRAEALLEIGIRNAPLADLLAAQRAGAER